MIRMQFDTLVALWTKKTSVRFLLRPSSKNFFYIAIAPQQATINLWVYFRHEKASGKKTSSRLEEKHYFLVLCVCGTTPRCTSQIGGEARPSNRFISFKSYTLISYRPTICSGLETGNIRKRLKRGNFLDWEYIDKEVHIQSYGFSSSNSPLQFLYEMYKASSFHWPPSTYLRTQFI